MPEIKQLTPGAFCWTECATDDPAGSRKFYSSLFGWQTKEMPMGEGSSYSMAELGGKQVAGLTQLPEEAKKMGAPPHWLSYVAVEDVDATARKVTSLGGSLLVGPMAAGPGRMAVFRDPTGGVAALWQSSESMGGSVRGEPGTVGWNELFTTDVDRAGKFYTDLFGWSTEAFAGAGSATHYVVFKNRGEQVGGMMAIPKEMKGMPSVWNVYFAVADTDGVADKAKSLGAKVMTGPADIPEVGRFAFLTDPQGAAFAIIKFLPRAK